MRHGRSDYQERIQDSANIIPAEEPVFLLRAQDKLAPEMVKHYSMVCREFAWAIRYGREQGTEEQAIELIQTADRTLYHARLMEQWQAAHGAKLPTAPVEAAAVSRG